MNLYNDPLNISNLNSVLMKTSLALILVGEVQPATSVNLSSKLTQQLSDSLQVPVTSFTNTAVLPGELFDADHTICL